MQEYIVRVYEESERGESGWIKEIWFDKKSGELHRIGGPAVTCWGGTKFYYKNGKKHREDGPAVIYSDGYQLYYINGELHREGGPAVIWSNGAQFYYKNGEFHREDGPAIIYPDGSEDYYLEGLEYSKQEFFKKTQKYKITIDGKEIEISQESFESLKVSLK